MEERSAPHISILYFVPESHLVTLPLLYAHFRILLRRLRNPVRTVGAAQCGGGRGSLPQLWPRPPDNAILHIRGKSGKRQERSTDRVRQRDVRRKLLPGRHVWHEYELGGRQVTTHRPDRAKKTVERRRLGDVFLCAKRQRFFAIDSKR